jgi:DNA-binding MarR family transcriptional regulator
MMIPMVETAIIRAPAPSLPSEDAADPESATRVLRRFRVVFNAVKAHFQQVERRAGIGGAQVWALSLIAERPEIGVGELARSMDIHQTTASNLVKALMLAGLIETHRNAPDRRTVQLRVLPAGLEVLKKAPGPFSGVLPDALSRLDRATLDRLDQDLGALIALLKVDERSASIPLAQM